MTPDGSWNDVVCLLGEFWWKTRNPYPTINLRLSEKEGIKSEYRKREFSISLTRFSILCRPLTTGWLKYFSRRRANIALQSSSLTTWSICSTTKMVAKTSTMYKNNSSPTRYEVNTLTLTVYLRFEILWSHRALRPKQHGLFGPQ